MLVPKVLNDNLKSRFISSRGLGAQVPKQTIQHVGLALGNKMRESNKRKDSNNNSALEEFESQ